jgi:hypothetical protein
MSEAGLLLAPHRAAIALAPWEGDSRHRIQVAKSLYSEAMEYHEDLYQWTVEQSAALKRRAGNELDWDNVAEEIEALGRSERKELGSRLEILLIHLLKLAYQPEAVSPSWRGSIREARNRIEDVLEESPSLRSYAAGRLPRAYGRARIEALEQTGLTRLPEACPWAIEDVLSKDFWPL